MLRLNWQNCLEIFAESCIVLLDMVLAKNKTKENPAKICKKKNFYIAPHPLLLSAKLGKNGSALKWEFSRKIFTWKMITTHTLYHPHVYFSRYLGLSKSI